MLFHERDTQKSSVFDSPARKAPEQTVPQLWKSASWSSWSRRSGAGKEEVRERGGPGWPHPLVQGPATSRWPRPVLNLDCVNPALHSRGDKLVVNGAVHGAQTYFGLVCAIIVSVCLFHEIQKSTVSQNRPFLITPPPTLLPSGTCRLRLTDGFSKGTVGALSTHGKPCGHSSPERIPQSALSQAGYDNDVEQMLTAPVRLP